MPRRTTSTYSGDREARSYVLLTLLLLEAKCSGQ
jgi:hypothetical protein